MGRNNPLCLTVYTHVDRSPLPAKPSSECARLLSDRAGLLTCFLTTQAGLLTHFLTLRVPDRF